MHQRASAQTEAAPLQAEQVPHLLRPHGWREGASRSVGLQGRRLRDRPRGHPRGGEGGLPRNHQHHDVRRRRQQIGPRVLRRDDGRRRRRHDDLAGLLLRQGARPAALHGTRRQPVDVPQTPVQSRPALAIQHVARSSSSSSWESAICIARRGVCPLTASSAGRSPAICCRTAIRTRFQELLDSTDWSKYGYESGNPKCANCMLHSGYEASAVHYTFSFKGVFATVRAMLFSNYRDPEAQRETRFREAARVARTDRSHRSASHAERHRGRRSGPVGRRHRAGLRLPRRRHGLPQERRTPRRLHLRSRPRAGLRCVS